MLRFRVPDFDSWRPLYEGSYERMTAVRSYRLWRSQDDPNLVILTETYESREAGEAMLADPAVIEEITEHGIDIESVQLDRLDLVGEASR